MSSKAIILDVDGTLVDSVDFHARAWQEAFQHFGHTCSFESIRSQIGKGGDQLMPVFLSKEEVKARGKEIETHRGDLFKKNYLPRVQPFPRVRELLQRFLADGWDLALASSAKKDELKIYKKIAQITDLIDVETSADDADKSKPYPDIFQAAMKKLGRVSPGDCIVIGDSPYDAEAANKAGIPAIGFLCGGFPESALRHTGCVTVYQGAADLLENYGQSLFARKNAG